MDPIELYLHQHRNISLNVIVATVYRLQVIELQQSYLTYPQVQETVRVVFDTLSTQNIENENKQEEAILFYSGLIYESLLAPRMCNQGPAFCLKNEIKEQAEVKIVQYLIHTFRDRDPNGGGLYAQATQDLERQIQRFIGSFPNEERNTIAPPEPSSIWKGNSAHSSSLIPAPSILGQSSSRARVYSGSGSAGSINYSTNDINRDDEDFASGIGVDEEYQQHPAERNEAMIKFLAHVRKSGMDIMLPQITHDKLLVVIYIATKCAAPLAHRQLMDMILAAKQTKILGNDLETVSKTKIRGILALLKNSNALSTLGGNGESVRLALGKGVINFRNFREKHDSYLNRCIAQQHTFLPILLKAEIIWHGDEQALSEKCRFLEKLEPVLEDYFITGGMMSKKKANTSSLSVPTNHSGVKSLSSRPDNFGQQMNAPPIPPGLTSSHSTSYGFRPSSPPTSYSVRDVNQFPPRNQNVTGRTSQLNSSRLLDEYGSRNGSATLVNSLPVSSPALFPPSKSSENVDTFFGLSSSRLDLLSNSFPDSNRASVLLNTNTNPNNNSSIIEMNSKFSTYQHSTMTDEKLSFSSYEK